MLPDTLNLPGIEVRETPVSEQLRVWLESQASAQGVLLVPEFGGNAYPSSARALAKLFTAAGVPVHWAANDRQFVEFRSNDWVAPVLVILATSQAEASATYSVVLGIISNYLSQLFFGSSQETQARLKIRDRKGDKFREIDYSGPVGGISALTETVKALNAEQAPNAEQKTDEKGREESQQAALPSGETKHKD